MNFEEKEENKKDEFMGRNFVMSIRLNKSRPSEFGLVADGIENAINPQDGSIWKKCSLYDFGWGAENGFYRLPLPGFSALMRIVLDSDNNDDMYGAAAIILQKYPAELLCYCEKLLDEGKNNKEFEKLFKIFKLEQRVNRSPIINKTDEQIQRDFERWTRISDIFQKGKNRDDRKGLFWGMRRKL